MEAEALARRPLGGEGAGRSESNGPWKLGRVMIMATVTAIQRPLLIFMAEMEMEEELQAALTLREVTMLIRTNARPDKPAPTVGLAASRR